MAQIKIRIGAALDASFDHVMASAEKRGSKAAQKIAAEQKRAAMQGLKAQEQSQRAFAKNEDQRAAAAERAARRGARAELKAFDERLAAARRNATAQERLAQRVAMTAERESRRSARAAERDARRVQRMQGDTLDRFARRTSWGAARFFAPRLPVASMARRAGQDITQGLGIDLNMGASIRRVTELDTLMSAISRKAWRPGAGDESARLVPTGELRKAVLGVAEPQGMDPMELGRGLESFVEITGELPAGVKLLGNVAEIAGSSATSMDVLVAATGRFWNGLADGPDKVARLTFLLRQFAGQTKTGSFDMEDFARQGAKMVAGISGFGGDFSKNAAFFGALAQQAVGGGGAAGGSQAATSVLRLREVFQKPARLAAWRELGIDPYMDKGETTLRSPQWLMEQALIRTGGSKPKIGGLFGSSIAQRLANRSADIFARTEGGTPSKMAAVRADWENLIGKSMETEAQERRANNERLKDTNVRAQKFQNEYDQVTTKMMASLLPALQALAPKVLSVANAFGGLVSWAAANPWKAVGGALAASIARAGIEAAVRAALEEVILRSAFHAGLGGVVRTAGGGYLAAGGGQAGLAGLAGMGLGARVVMGSRLVATQGLRAGFAGGGLMGGLGAAGTVLGAGAAAAGGAYLAYDQISKLQKENESEGGWMNAFDKAGGIKGGWNAIGGRSIIDFGATENAYGETSGMSPERLRAAGIEADRKRAAAGTLNPTALAAGGQDSKAMAAAQQNQADALRGVRDKLAGTINVRVSNPEDIRQRAPAAGVPTEGRTLK